MSRHTIVALAVLALVAAACNSQLGADTPECVDVDGDVAGSIILEAQSVPSAEYGPCINGLLVGWDFQPIQFESGRSWFWLDSDRVGNRFLEVTLAASCDPGAAIEVDSGQEGIRLFQTVEKTTAEVRFAIIPVADRHAAYADQLAFSLQAREFVVVVGFEGETLSRQIENAGNDGYNVLIVDDRDVENGTVSLREAGEREEEADVGFVDLLSRFEPDPDEQRYQATWYYTFAGGCVTYAFDAEGPGAEAISDEVELALGFFDLELLRKGARRAGYNI